MQIITINIEWSYFLGIMGSLILIAWYTSARFTVLETSMQWIKEIINDIKIASDNTTTDKPAFSSSSPINLTPIGEEWLIKSGLKEYLDTHKDELMKICEEKRVANPYEVQKYIFRTFDTLDFEPDFEDKLKKFAFGKGTTMNIMRRVGAIHFRNLCLSQFEMNKEDIDRYDPEKPQAS